jgi:DNA-binding transcriptional regulator YdaS (Cro superfamily)
MNQIERAVGLVGGITKLAMVLGVTPQAVAFWRDGKRRLPVEACPAIERATGGAVTRKELRPDDWQTIWPELATQEVSTPPLDKLSEHVIVEAIKANLIKDRRVFVRRAEDRKRLGLDIGSAGQGV